MKIGIRTAFFTILLLTLIALAVYYDLYAMDQVKKLQPLTLCAIGALGVFLSGIAYLFIGQIKTSQFLIAMSWKDELISGRIDLFRIKRLAVFIGENRGPVAYDFPLWFQKLMLIPIFFIFTMFIINSRTIQLISDAYISFKDNKSGYCPPEDDNESNKESEIPPGCELIVRAYELGYSNSLGDCEPKDAVKEEDDICRLRQVDEPFLHFTFRQLGQILDNFSVLNEDYSITQELDKFKEQTDDLDALLANQVDSMTSTPHSAHIVITNLPKPPKSILEKFNELTQSNYCLSAYRDLPNTIDIKLSDEGKNSKEFEFSYAHLLFNDRQQNAVGFCPEFEILWEEDANFCQSLAQRPVETLKDAGVWGRVSSVLNRYKAMASKLSKDDKANQLPLSRFISFQCILVSDESTDKISDKFVLKGHKFTATTSRLDRTSDHTNHGLPKSTILGLAQTLVPHYSYSAFQSNQQIAAISEQEAYDLFVENNDHLMLSKLEVLRKTDIMLGNNWLHEHPDLLEVYPWHLHLYNFVSSFRREYHNSRGRL